MDFLSTYVVSLPQVMHLIAEGRTTEADFLVNNLYHQSHRSAAEFIELLRLTRSHGAYVTAERDHQNQLAEILYLLDRKHNSPYHPYFVAFRKAADEHGVEQTLFSIIEKECDSPAH